MKELTRKEKTKTIPLNDQSISHKTVVINASVIDEVADYLATRPLGEVLEIWNKIGASLQKNNPQK